MNDVLIENIETFSRTIEQVQRYYTSFIKNFEGSSNLNFAFHIFV
ncbi:MAG TPA: hypothetical protein VFP25_02290 [Nitrososphaeraceae archaeon]|nr:hypothetical protein [Nitrososphaeraceae archaeon]